MRSALAGASEGIAKRIASGARGVLDVAQGVAILRQSLTTAQRAERTLAIRKRIASAGKRNASAIMEQVQAAVTRRIDDVVRDDVIAEIYLAVIEGRIEVEQIAAAARSFVSRGLADWQSAYGPRSLDAKLFDDGSRTLSDAIGDDTAMAAIDDITIGEQNA